MKIVKFKNGKYGIRRMWFLYLDRTSDMWWPRFDMKYVIRYCTFDEIYDAHNRVLEYNHRKDGHEEYKVIKTFYVKD